METYQADMPPIINDNHKSWFQRISWFRIGAVILLLLIVPVLGLMWWWDTEPQAIDGIATAEAEIAASGGQIVTGTMTTEALKQVVNQMLNKRGGYLSNDVLSPAIFMDNLPNWEFGVLVQCRDLARALRNGFSRSQTQSVEDPDLQEAEPALSFTNDRWLFPSSESQYREAIEFIESYQTRLQDADSQDARFFARADNLADYLGVVESRLGSLSQRLSASVGVVGINTETAEVSVATRTSPLPQQGLVRTSWFEIDDVFYETRGTAFALAQFLRAVEVDFATVLEDKNARVSLQQVIRELEDAQQPVSSPMILNGSTFGLFANHSLVLANYISRANATLIELRKLLERG
ncbi:MAG: DUF2333 family protein [Pseudomonadota bacterium]